MPFPPPVRVSAALIEVIDIEVFRARTKSRSPIIRSARQEKVPRAKASEKAQRRQRASGKVTRATQRARRRYVRARNVPAAQRAQRAFQQHARARAAAKRARKSARQKQSGSEWRSCRQRQRVAPVVRERRGVKRQEEKRGRLGESSDFCEELD